MSSSWSFSQALKPKVLPIEGQTHFCFVVPQIKIIAEQLATKALSDSVIHILEDRQHIQEQLIINQHDRLKNYLEKIANQKEFIDFQKDEINQVRVNKDKIENQYVKYRRKSKTLSVGMAVLAAILIIK